LTNTLFAQKYVDNTRTKKQFVGKIIEFVQKMGGRAYRLNFVGGKKLIRGRVSLNFFLQFCFCPKFCIYVKKKILFSLYAYLNEKVECAFNLILCKSFEG
jgi:hypothetical protein